METLLFLIAASYLGGAPKGCSGMLIDNGQRLRSGLASTAVTLADFDGDGDLDAFVPNYVGPIVLWRNRGNGIFEQAGEPFGASLSGKVLAADFDDDLDIDVFTVNHSFQTTLWRNDGTGKFTSDQNLGSAGMHAADFGDLDGDNDLDIFVGSIGGHWNAALFNDGSGRFTWSEQNNALPVARAVALADLDRDRDLDVFLARGNNGAQPNGVLLNNGDGTFVDTGQQLGLEYSTDVELADLDGDGDVDAFVANADLFDNDPADTIWLNDGTGHHFVDSGQRLGPGLSTWDVDLGDFDCDGDIDAYAPHTNGLASLYLNNGRGVFLEVIVQDAGLGTRSAVGDLDDDHDLDVFSITGGQGDMVLLNRGGLIWAIGAKRKIP